MIYAVIVTFNPVISNVSSLVSTLLKSGVIPIVVDNNSKNDFEVDCTLLKIPSNKGIAFAQNRGIEAAVNQGASKIVFFDQDSILPGLDFINKLSLPIFNKLSSITAPIFVDEVRGFTYPIVNIESFGGRTKSCPNSSHLPFYVNNVISSGTMVDVEVFHVVGLMKEELFIDYVDTEWCLRSAEKGYQILVVPSAVMYHSIGDSSFSIFGFNIPKHSPSRRYYRIRNSFYLIRQTHIPKLMALREIVFSFIHQLILIAYSKGERLAYSKSLFKGLIHGLKGRFGAC